MKKNEMIRQRQANLRQTNAYAMQNGLILGLWAIGCQACYVGGLTYPILSTFWLLSLLGIPVMLLALTLSFRRVVGLDVNFPFSRGFMHAFLTMLYTAIWAAIATYIYMAFVDKGYIFDHIYTSVTNPETLKAMEDSGLTQQIAEATGGHTLTEVIDDLRSIGAATWTAAIIYMYMLTSPVLAMLVGLCTMRRVHYRKA